jgi:hypothetical protein
MGTGLELALNAIFAYAYGMDTANWELAVSQFAETANVDYSAVGMTKAAMTKSQIRTFLQGLLDKDKLKVHTAISQVFSDPAKAGHYIAYYSVRHYKGDPGQALKFAVFGWYSYALEQGKIVSLVINVSAMEGDPAVLA